jgi:crotonobetainyl-CoA:carnitine CoA-transferase CaiB-like acyl-CoA transferase
MPDSSPPYSGLLVVDFSRVLAGPLCTQLLADAGARVIKVEEPGRGDETRRWGPPFVEGISGYFLSINRNKESLTLNLRTAEGREAARRLIERADVVVDNFLPAQRTALGLTFDEVRRINPPAVHCSIAGYDSESAEASLPGYDLLAQAESGLMAITGEPGGAPAKVGVALSDVLTAHHAYGAIGAALFARERSGRGESIEVSLFGATLASLVNVAQAALLTGEEAKRYGNEHASIVPYQLFRAADRDFVVGAGTDRHFGQLAVHVLQRPELAGDPRFATNAARVENRIALIELLGQIFYTRPAAEWVEGCRRRGVPAALVQGVREALQSPLGRRLTVGIEHPVFGRYEAVGSPVKLGGGRREEHTAPPELGQDSEKVLEELGYSAEEIGRMRAAGVV